ncbi:MAG TPA: TetR/AcrR family transcriptional regulator [Gemmatimonadales bacterium]|nr:TetR/AcrR family transcriptional regulator [Gemmatimonadales bacterium]
MTKSPPQSPDTDEDRRRWSRRPESRPAEILKAAFAVFTEAGYDRTTIADVGKRAGVSPALVVHYFGTKAELFAAVIQDRFGSFVAAEEAMLASHRGSYRELLHRLLRRFWEHLWEPGSIELAVAVKAERVEFPECARIVSQVGARWRGLIEGVLEAGRQNGEFGVSGPHVARVISAMVMGVAEASRCFSTVESPAPSPEELWSTLVAFLDHGVLAPQGEAQ